MDPKENKSYFRKSQGLEWKTWAKVLEPKNMNISFLLQNKANNTYSNKIVVMERWENS